MGFLSALVEITPQRLQCGNTCDGSCLGTQYARAEQDRSETGLLRDIGLISRKTAFGADEQDGATLGLGCECRLLAPPGNRMNFAT